MVNDQIKNGNYRMYYEFRPQDSRPQQLEKCVIPWFAERLTGHTTVRMLDIGCNSGKLTNAVLTIVRKALPGKCCTMLGVDIDEQLITVAREQHQSVGLHFESTDIYEAANGTRQLDPIGAALEQAGSQRFEVIFCFSILMYVHLNHGDDGLRSVLNYLCGRAEFLVLELQSWKKYRDHVRRMHREGGGDYPSYGELTWKGNDGQLEKFISDYVTQQGFSIVDSSAEKNEFNRNIICFVRNS
ncbi:probable RNA methyltransferase CG11342 [Sabethes cyaneus]|uniref:probable RNA methyltransferase CG11342 n=1 Tax=Sabethes cyaneus TaxID=53552 RepID=UPI00237DE9C7|nr:probable RNA methyltransferase CG11342 [Sabethes cyaneus]